MVIMGSSAISARDSGEFFCEKSSKKVEKSLEGKKKCVSLQPVSEETRLKFFENIER